MTSRVCDSPPPSVVGDLLNAHIAPPPSSLQPQPQPQQQQQQQASANQGTTVATNPTRTPQSAPPASSSSSNASSTRRTVGDYYVDHKIGSGSFATVWRGRHKLTNQVVAIKSVSKDKIMVNKKHQENLDMEITIMQRIKHPNVVQLYEVKDTARHKYLILEYCSGGDLSRLIRRCGPMSEKVARGFFGQLAAGLKCLRSMNLIHRDLKPQNLLLDGGGSGSSSSSGGSGGCNHLENLRLLIADFGFARYMEADNLAMTLCGSPLYMAPEILSYKEYDATVDLWSVGTILFEMLTGKPPFTGQNHIALLTKINTTEFKIPSGLELTQECTSLLHSLLKRNPRERISFDAFFAHPFVVQAMQEQTKRQEQADATAAAAIAAQQAHQQQQQQQQQRQQSDIQQIPQSAPTAPLPSQSPSPIDLGSPVSAPPSRTQTTMYQNLQHPSSSPVSSIQTPNSCSTQQLTQQQLQQQRSQSQSRSYNNTHSSLYGSAQQFTPQQQQQQNQQQQQSSHPSQQQQQQFQPQQQQYQQVHSIQQRSSPSLHPYSGSNVPPAFQLNSNSNQQLQQQQQLPSFLEKNALQYQQQLQQQQQQQLYQNSTHPHDFRPLHRTITPSQGLNQLNSNGTHMLQNSGDGSRDGFVWVPNSSTNEASPSQSGAAMTGNQQQIQQQQTQAQQQQSSSTSSPYLSSSFDLLGADTQSTLQSLDKQASHIVKTADTRIESLRKWLLLDLNMSHVHTSLVQQKQEIVARALEEFNQLMDEKHTATTTTDNSFNFSSSSFFNAPHEKVSPEELLMSSLELCLKALAILGPPSRRVDESLHHALRILAQRERTLLPLALQNNSNNNSNNNNNEISEERSNIYQIQQHLAHRVRRILERCHIFRKALEELSGVATSTHPNQHVNTVRVDNFSGTHPRSQPSQQQQTGKQQHQQHQNSSISSAANSRRSSLGGPNDEESKEQILGSSVSNRSPHISPTLPPSSSSSSSISASSSSPLSTFSTPCAEKQLFDEILSKCREASEMQILGHYKISMQNYKAATYLIAALKNSFNLNMNMNTNTNTHTNTHANQTLTQHDLNTLNSLEKAIQQQIKFVQLKIAQKKQQRQQQQENQNGATPPVQVN